MITATVFQDSGDSGDVSYRGIEIKGHAGWAEAGEDIICAGVSALAVNFYNSVEEFTEDSFEGEAGQKDVQFSFRFTSQIRPESKLLINSLVLGLQNIERDYGKSYIIIRFEEV